ncbi:MAG: PKD domain-containing protein, partial [Flavobacteriales bacterium]|nr:PKD domain-containing protein [Flavobacteriales bacterium]
MIHFRSLAVGLLALAMHQAHAQGSVTMTAGFAEICQGVLYDSGNAGGGGYDNNEDLTVTLCPDQPGAVMSIHFIVFDLDQSGASGTWDNLSIYDGEDTDGTFLGSYTGSELQGLVVNATLFNPTGCLTLRFISNAIGTGNFTASIACFVPCVPPTAAASMSLPSPARICPGGSVQFDGSASTPGPGQVLTSYAWHLGPTTVVTSTEPTLDHVFDAPGSYPIGLVATDANGCASTNSVDLVVQVSTAPEFTLTTSDTVACVGGMIALDAGVQSVPWAANTVEYGDGIALPDDVGVPFVSQLLVTGLEPGASVGSVDDIAAVCVDMEHSFMGDLVLQVICPNGSEVTLHQQGGGGTYVGGAYDGDTSAEPTPGECWHYCW